MAASKIVDKSKKGLIVGIDLLPYKAVPGFPSITGDFRDIYVQQQLDLLLEDRAVNVVLSDMLHNTTGQRCVDHSRSMELVHVGLDFCEKRLARRGIFFAKYLKGSEEKELFDRIKEMFNHLKFVKPKASRSESNEMFILCTDKKRLSVV